MSECCFHVQIHFNYLSNISGGVAAATCFDLLDHSVIAHDEVTPCAEFQLCNCMYFPGP